MIFRESYIQRLLKFQDKHLIKVVTGVRRCGKSTLLAQFQAELQKQGVEQNQIIALNFEDFRNRELCSAKTLHEYILSRTQSSQKHYVFFDEIQNVENFPAVADSLFLRENIDLYLTGSNAQMLSGELATLLSGRYIKIPLLPLSFAEFRSLRENETPERCFSEYRRIGGFPFLAAETSRDSESDRAYLEGIYSTVLLKDISARRKLSNTLLLEDLIRFLADNTGKIFSTKKIADTLTSAGRKITSATLEALLSALTEAFVFYRAKRYDVNGKQYLKTGDKYYIVDPGLRNYILSGKGGDISFQLENLVYLELIRRGYEVFIGKIGDYEIDFIAVRGNEKRYCQVALSARDPETRERELRPLKKLRDRYPCLLITLDDDPPADFDGIRQVNAIDFFLKKENL